jgi:hypothetical protein
MSEPARCAASAGISSRARLCDASHRDASHRYVTSGLPRTNAGGRAIPRERSQRFRKFIRARSAREKAGRRFAGASGGLFPNAKTLDDLANELANIPGLTTEITRLPFSKAERAWGPRPRTNPGCRIRASRCVPPNPLWLQSAHYSGELSLRKARCMRPPWTGAFLQRNAGLAEFPCGRGFAVEPSRACSADTLGQAPPGASEIAFGRRLAESDWQRPFSATSAGTMAESG